MVDSKCTHIYQFMSGCEWDDEDDEKRPQVSLLQRTPSSPVVCHATGFYPDRVMVFWKRDDQELEDVVSGEKPSAAVAYVVEGQRSECTE
ncbi:hypothetical protein CRUP_001818 [Coryphaenoides rupestris]|nr:hypothetical protein CRUP_001818 [Coryphaenoides rupestris]